MKQTAVEWLAKELEDYGDSQILEITWEDLDSLVIQAKEIEKNQIKDAYRTRYIKRWDSLNAEQYYNETFKSE